MLKKTAPDFDAFLTKWSASGAAERANAQPFILDLCRLLDVAPPAPKTPDEAANAYVFEKTIPGATGNKQFIDCYKRGHFVLEAKQGVDAAEDGATFSLQGEQQRRQRKTGHGKRGTLAWDTAMQKAHKQAENYARLLPREEIKDLRPPFIMVVDVGHSIALYADWSRAGGHYTPFPDPANYRIALKDLVDDEKRELLRTVWTDPLSLDPTRRSARVTREIADRLARLAKSLEHAHSPERVAGFLMRCLFTMFAEDVELLPERSFTQLLDDLKRDPSAFTPMLQALWETMNTGGFSVVLRRQIPKFNGGLFASPDVIELNEDQIQLLTEAAQAQWKDVEPAIFGTLLERALDPRERHKLGAHYTPRAYVERLVQPTIIEPLRAEWEAVQVAALQLANNDQLEAARAEVEKFLRRLANLRILDPACGSGNFLYVTLELLKRLEGEVLNNLRDLGQEQMSLELAGVMVTPANLLGIELNPRAAAIAELVLWIGFLQWHLRTRGELRGLPEPIIRDLHNVECRDAVLDWDDRRPQIDKNGQAVTRWDGRTTMPHPVTGEEVPDPSARVRAYEYVNPRPAKWPVADFIVGNPPFVGMKRMRLVLGDGYTEAIRKAYERYVPESADYVMYWWHRCAEMLKNNEITRFGLITTNSISQIFNRKVIDFYLSKKSDLISLKFVIPDHPWVDDEGSAAVRIAMTVAIKGDSAGKIQKIISEAKTYDPESIIEFTTQEGKINADLSVGADTTAAIVLEANKNLSFWGVKFYGKGFILTQDEVEENFSKDNGIKLIKPFVSGQDLTKTPRNLFVIDCDGLSVNDLLSSYPAIYQHLLDHVKPVRDENPRKQKRDYWWLFGENQPAMRNSIKGIDRFIVTAETSKHRTFQFISHPTIPEGKVAAIALADAYFLGILSSKFHVCWSMAAGGRLGVGNDSVYNKTRCFDPFPFPTPTDAQQTHIRDLAERLDAHRKRQQAPNPDLTMTDLYNVLEKERAGEPLTAKERTIHEQGLVGILRQLHDELDAAVAAAYGWPADLDDHEILERLVALNAERAAEEANGLIRWLRPDYQAPDAAPTAVQGKLAIEPDAPEAVAPTTPTKRPWPDALPARAAALRDVLAGFAAPVDTMTVAAAFEGKRTEKRLREVESLLETLVALGQAEGDGQRWVVR